MAVATTLSDSTFTGLPLLHKGKVRDGYSVGDDMLLLVATDRLSAFDCVLPTPIDYKGAVLTSLSAFWFKRLSHIVDNHLITTELDEMPEDVRRHEILRGRSTLVKKTEVFPVECVVRGYLEGSGWKDYLADRSVCGRALPAGLKHCDKLIAPIFTPATKAVSGHDENITQVEFMNLVGHDTAAELKSISKQIYTEASEYALTRASLSPIQNSNSVAIRKEISYLSTKSYTRFVTFLGRLKIRTRPRTSLIRQAVRPRISRNPRLGQNTTRTAAPGRVAQATSERY